MPSSSVRPSSGRMQSLRSTSAVADLSSVNQRQLRAQNWKPKLYLRTSRYDRRPRTCSSVDRALASGA